MSKYSIYLNIKSQVSEVLKRVDKNLNSTIDTFKKLKSEAKTTFDTMAINSKRAMQDLPNLTKGLSNNISKSGALFSKDIREGSLLLKNSLGTLTALTASLGAGVIFPIQKAREYEDTMLEVSRALTMTTDQQMYLRKSLMTMEGGTFKELGAIAANIAKAGVQDINEVVKITDVLNKASKAIGLDVEMSQTAITKILSLNDLATTGESVLRVADQMANLENTMSNVSASQLSDVWKRAVKPMKLYNFTLEEQGALAATLLSRGTSPELAASEWIMFSNRIGKASKAMGIDFESIIKGRGLEGLKEVIKTLSSDKIGLQRLEKVMGAEAKKLILTLQTDVAMSTLDDALKSAKSAGGTVLREWGAYVRTFTYSWNELVKSVSNLVATLGTPMIGALGPVFYGFSKIINAIVIILNKFPILNQIIGYGIMTLFSFFSILTSVSLGMKLLGGAGNITAISMTGLKLAFISLIKTMGFVNFGIGIFLQSLGKIILMPVVFSIKMLITSFGFLFNIIKLVSLSTGKAALRFVYLNSILMVNNIKYFILNMRTVFTTLVMTSVATLKATLNFIRLNAALLLSNGVSFIRNIFLSIASLSSLRMILGNVILSIRALNLAMLVNPFALFATAVISAIGALLYLMWNWREFSNSIREGYNSYISPVLDSFKSAFYQVFGFFSEKLIGAQILWKEFVLALANNPISGKVFGAFDFDIDSYKNSIEKLKAEQTKVGENTKEAMSNIRSNFTEKEWEDSSFNQFMEKGQDFLKNTSSGVFDTLKGLNSTFGEGLAKQETENPLMKAFLEKASKPAAPAKIELDIKVRDNYQTVIKTRQQRAELTQNLRTVRI